MGKRHEVTPTRGRDRGPQGGPRSGLEGGSNGNGGGGSGLRADARPSPRAGSVSAFEAAAPAVSAPGLATAGPGKRNYSAEFRAGAVPLVLKEGRSVLQAAAALGMPMNNPCHRTQPEQDPSCGATRTVWK